MYVKQPLQDAAEEVLVILGEPSSEQNQDSEWSRYVRENEDLKGIQYEIDQAIYILRAALGMPVPRQRCPECDARDSIFWEKEPLRPELAPTDNPDQLMWCHKCGMIDPPREWVTEIIEAENG